MSCRVYLPAAASQTRAGLIVEEGAEVVRVDGGYAEVVAAAEHASDRSGITLLADTSADVTAADGPAWVIDGYSTLFREAAAQAPAPFDVVIVGVGVGSLAAAAVRWAAHEHPAAAVIGVEPVTAACVTASLRAGEVITVPTPGTSMAGLDCATPSAVAWPTLRDGLAGAIAVTDAETHQAMRDLAAHGLTIGDCGAATLAGLRVIANAEDGATLRAAVALDSSTTVLCVGTEGASDPVAYRRTVAEPDDVGVQPGDAPRIHHPPSVRADRSSDDG
jgi:diaminopropionate ammonia-lyase